LPGRPTATVSRVVSRSMTSAGEAASKYAPSGGPRAIDQNHPLCTLAAFRLADLGPPFLAGIKLPSAKHASQQSFCASLSWAKKARQSLSSTPVSSHCLSRRQQVLGLLYRRGSSLHCAPVQRIQRMPSKQRRSSTRGRQPREVALGCGRWTPMAAHCCLVSRRHAMVCLGLLLGNAWRYDTPTGWCGLLRS
jgi:hypothetical protein